MPGQTIIDQLFQLFLDPSFDTDVISVFLKILFIAAFGIFIFFAAVVVRQVFMMTETIRTSLASMLKIFAVGYLILTVIVFVLVLMV